MNTKSKKNIMLTAGLGIMLGTVSCGKYEDGPGFSLKSKKARLVGEWEVVEVEDTDLDDEDLKINLEFDKDGDMKFKYTYYGYTYSEKGDWEWEDGKASIEVDLDGYSTEWEILKLTSEEFWFEDEDGLEWKCEKD